MMVMMTVIMRIMIILMIMMMMMTMKLPMIVMTIILMMVMTMMVMTKMTSMILLTMMVSMTMMMTLLTMVIMMTSMMTLMLELARCCICPPLTPVCRYWDGEAKRLDFTGLCEDLSSAPANSVIILHACAHNPTGVDLTRDQWEKVADICRDGNLFPFFDCAYQGFASGCLDTDAWAVR